jgi:hypothetical protein
MGRGQAILGLYQVAESMELGFNSNSRRVASSQILTGTRVHRPAAEVKDVAHGAH